MYWALWTLVVLAAGESVTNSFLAVKQQNNNKMVASIIGAVLAVFALFELVRI